MIEGITLAAGPKDGETIKVMSFDPIECGLVVGVGTAVINGVVYEIGAAVVRRASGGVCRPKIAVELL